MTLAGWATPLTFARPSLGLRLLPALPQPPCLGRGLNNESPLSPIGLWY